LTAPADRGQVATIEFSAACGDLMLRRLGFVTVLLVLVACGQRGVVTIDPVARGIGTIEPVFIGTTRNFDPATQTFGSQRSPKLTLARLDISVPPDREPGQIKWPKKGREADPRTDFVATDQVIFSDAASFRKDLSQSMRSEKSSKRQALIFVHGFNNTFAEGAYRIAQLSYDLDLPRVTVHYSWPSAGKALGYVHDRDSSLYARDGLEKLFNEVVAAGAEEVIVVGHSMGCLLLVETLRQMDIRDSGNLRRHLKGVVLLSPDIDVEVFRSQASTFGVLPQPFIIFSSQGDKALRLSALITGEPSRLGNIRDLNQVAGLDVRVVDVTAFSTGSGHFNVGDSPELISLIDKIGSVQAAFDSDNSGRIGLLPGIVLTARNTTAIVVKPVELLNDELQK
jgi:esterase/lipase superfamily enzyme